VEEIQDGVPLEFAKLPGRVTVLGTEGGAVRISLEPDTPDDLYFMLQRLSVVMSGDGTPHALEKDGDTYLLHPVSG
jgi:hypothetical protein